MTKLIAPSKYHRTLDGIELVKQREQIGLTQAEFADKCGWSQQYQQQLEIPKEQEIPVATAENILRVILFYK